MSESLSPRRFPLLIVASICLTVLLSGYSIWKRFQVEEQNRSVAIAADYESIEALASGQGMTMDKALEDVSAQGLNALVLSEDSIGGLISEGRARLVVSPAAAGKNPLALEVEDDRQIERIVKGLRIRFGNLAFGRDSIVGTKLKLPDLSAQLIRSTPVGLDPDVAAMAVNHHLQIIARCSNTGGERSAAVRQTLQWAHDLGATIFLPQGDEVLGRRDSIDDLIDSLKTIPMLYASPEFAKIAGDTDVLDRAPSQVVRLHSAQTAELDKLSPIDAVDRYVKAARERNMRVLLIRPLSLAAPQPLGAFDQFVKEIDRQILKNGQEVGKPHAFWEPGIPKPFFILLGLAIAPCVWFAVARFVTSKKVRLAGGVLLGLLALGCFNKLGAEAIALLGSMSFPILGFYALDSALPRMKGPLGIRMLAGFWLVSIFSIVGGLCVAGMLNSLAFYIRAAEFQAVKLSVFLPIVIVGVHYFLTLSDWKGALKSPITWGTSALCLGLGVILAVLIARTGNDTGLGPSGGEMVFRNLLDRFLYVRPRTKEFLIGHPFLVFGLGMLARLLRLRRNGPGSYPVLAGWTILALMMGAIGQTSIVNTMCHIHIPFTLSIARVLEGLVLGCIIGFGVWAAFGRFVPGREA
ncbi:MAG TPA: DUF5693 family protein [Fimbriimonas sp.]|nr:DUF5693 family protein [Fimbriimonas sp.]